MTGSPQAPDPNRDVDELHALIKAGGFWRLAPEWVPHTGYAQSDRQSLSHVEDGLRRLLNP
ncbi:hypothetical protein [Streptomyces sp. NRRL S-920]|uniref:hypothetical protein n=1 Tax=Streptomyces sp. NRRL S-920 TaxID=1463921 RepID=UPI0004CA7D18|nr:hypothetical protein [Streptomyces sp. NRRL S-920]